MNNRCLFFFVCLVAVLMVDAWGIDQAGVCAQSLTDTGAQAGQGGKDTSAKSGEISILKTQKDQMSYAIGVNLTGNFKKQGVDVDLDMVIKGMQDAFAGNKLLLSDVEFGRAIKQYQMEVRQKQAKILTITAEENKKTGEAFLEENGKKEGVVTLASGLQYRIIKSGDGKKPTDSDTVECQYRGTLIKGNEFDSSYRLGHPAIFKINGVIPGWKEALKLMPVGSVWQIFVPPQLAYKEQGVSGSIGPNATLIFEIELLAIK